jgi:hypothetical protein
MSRMFRLRNAVASLSVRDAQMTWRYAKARGATTTEEDFGHVLSHDVVEGGCLLGVSRRCVDLVQDGLRRQAHFGLGLGLSRPREAWCACWQD